MDTGDTKVYYTRIQGILTKVYYTRIQGILTKVYYTRVLKKIGK